MDRPLNLGRFSEDVQGTLRLHAGIRSFALRFRNNLRIGKLQNGVRQRIHDGRQLFLRALTLHAVPLFFSR